MNRSFLHVLIVLFSLSLLSSVSIGCAGSDGQCQRNSDCTGSNQRCVNGTCKRSSSSEGCKEDKDCASGETCTNGECKKKGGGGGCTQDSECAAGEKCESGTCKKDGGGNNNNNNNNSGNPKYNKCTKPEECTANENCVPLRSGAQSGFCFPKCDTKTKACQGGTGECNALQNGGGACIPSGTAKENDACGLGQDPANIDPSKLCGEGLICDNGKCVKSTKVGKYEKCGGTKVCDAANNVSCIQAERGAQHGYCFPSCPTVGQECEGGTGNCIEPQTGTKICLPKGTSGDGGGCSPGNDPKLEGKHFCQSGLQCTNGKCSKPPAAGKYSKCTSPQSCPQGTSCTTLSQGVQHGYCLPTCDTNQPTCDGGVGRCQAPQGGQPGQGLCIPNGKVPTDGGCDGDPNADKLDPNTSCASGNICLTFAQGATKGLCTPVVQGACGANSCAAGRICLALNQQVSGCLKDCSSGPSACQAPAACGQTQDGKKVCVRQ